MPNEIIIKAFATPVDGNLAPGIPTMPLFNPDNFSNKTYSALLNDNHCTANHKEFKWTFMVIAGLLPGEYSLQNLLDATINQYLTKHNIIKNHPFVQPPFPNDEVFTFTRHPTLGNQINLEYIANPKLKQLEQKDSSNSFFSHKKPDSDMNDKQPCNSRSTPPSCISKGTAP